MPKTPRVPTPERLKENWPGLFEALNNESDFICAVVSASYVEHCVRALLRRHLVNGSTAKDLLDPSKGALGAIHTASQAAYAMGLISAGCMQRIQTIGLVRNLFAHSVDSLTFSDQDVVRLCDDLKLPVQRNGHDVEPFLRTMGGSPRAMFTTISAMICSFLMVNALDAKHRDELKDRWPVTKREQRSQSEQSEVDSGPAE